MSSAKRDPKKPGKNLEDATPGASKVESVVFKPPLRPRKNWFVGLLVAFAIWVAVLAGMYVKTVYTPRHQTPSTRILQ